MSRRLSDQKQLSKAYMLASFKHKNQFDKGGKPYVEHVIAVSQLIDSDDIQVKTGALLHDIIEDTSETAASLFKKGFSDRVVAMVEAVSKRKGEDYGTYLTRVEENPDAIVIKMADLRHNSDFTRLKGTGKKDVGRISKYIYAYDRLSKKLAEWKMRGYPYYIYAGKEINETPTN